jgi:hypothetical protein
MIQPFAVLIFSKARSSMATQRIGLAVLSLCLSAACASSAAAYNKRLTDKYQRILTNEICRQPDWLTCYKIPPATCLDAFAPHVEACVTTWVRKPKISVKEPAQVEVLATQIAQCIQSSFTERHKDSKLVNEECKDIS